MRRNLSTCTLAAVSLVCVLVLAACSTSTPVLLYITVSPTSATTSVGGTVQFTALAYYSNGTVKDGTSLVAWSSSAPSVATIAGGGLATGVGSGTTTISASAAGTNGATATLTVNQLTSIAVTPANPTVPVGTNQQFTATATFTNPDGSKTSSDITATATWTSSNTAVATMDATATGQADVLATATVGQTSTITASQFGASGGTTLTAGAALPVSLAVTPAKPTIAIGTTATFTATETWSDGSTGHALAAAVTWTSGTTATAPIIATTGVALGLAAGTSTITATESSLTPPLTGTTTLTVAAGSTHFAYVANNGATIPNLEWFTVTAGTSPYFTAPSSNTMAVSGAPPSQTVVHPSGKFVYYTDSNFAVRVAAVNTTSGALTDSGFAAQPTSTATSGNSFAAIDPYGRFLYVAIDTDNAIYGFTINADGSLTPITGMTAASMFTTNLSSPEWFTVDHTGAYLYATNNTGNTVSVYKIDQTKGTLSAPTSGATIATGSGPEHGALDPTGTYLYVPNDDKTVSAYSISAGALTSLASITISAANNPFSALVDPSGTHLYILDFNITAAGQVFAFSIGTGGAIGSQIGSAQPSGKGTTGGFVIDPTGSLVASENNIDSNVSLYTVNSSTGALTAVTPAVTTGVARPFYVTFYNAAP